MPYDLDCLNGTPADATGHCPHHDRQGVCRASFSAMTIDRRRQHLYCASEDHDLCPLFLARQLRGSRPRYCGAGHQERIGK